MMYLLVAFIAAYLVAGFILGNIAKGFTKLNSSAEWTLGHMLICVFLWPVIVIWAAFD